MLHALMERKRSKASEGPITRLYQMTRCDYSKRAKRVAVGKSIAIRQFLCAGSGPTILTVIPAYSAFLTVLGSGYVKGNISLSAACKGNISLSAACNQGGNGWNCSRVNPLGQARGPTISCLISYDNKWPSLTAYS